ncbi:transposase [Mucilaginibacter polytrichastri]|uniref:Uncharacterized protein n=1 Tax=Mucilaginibacter polytrichastri TaxID=1302689 RepID=A0A1Q6A2D9_9SPHI|nr:transposase [Mucilaginibacter polytrichastri]OKS88173.1 hypothetical protein RG47T_3637 [Mucilaginibacter polytrichastri]SFT08901.1 Transposase [Mucilaginibacter polytrichastri]
MNVSKPKKFTYFIGIDVSRNELDFAIHYGQTFIFHKEIANELTAIKNVIEEIKKQPKFMMSKAVFCMENTGIYCNILINALKKFKANIVQENALQIRNSLGNIRGKHDKIDAIRIAQYAYRHREELRLWQSKRKIVQQVAYLSTIRFRLMSIQLALKAPLKEQQDFLSKKESKENVEVCKRSMTSIRQDIEGIEMRILELIASDENLKNLLDIITSITSIGVVTAVQMIIRTNEFRGITTAKKFACYAGVAPFKDESGTVIKKARVSHIANKKMKSLLHICAVGAMRYDKDIKAYYERKVAEGKPKMLIINAIRFKLITRVFTCVHQNRQYEKEYKRRDESYSV